MAKKTKPKTALKKPVKKAVKKIAKKTIKKVAPKKTTKAVSKKVLPKVKPKAKAKAKAIVAKKPTKKAVKLNLGKSIKSLKKKLAKKVAPKKAITKPVKKVVVKKKTADKKVTSKAAEFIAHKTSLKVGDKAPYFEGIEQDGNMVSLNGLSGKIVILYFYPKDDTPGCTATACSLRDEYKHLNDNHFAVIGVSADNEKTHAKFAAKYELPFPLLADTEKVIIKAYDVWGQKRLAGRIYDGIVRTTFIIGADGLIKEVITKVDTANHAQQILGM